MLAFFDRQGYIVFNAVDSVLRVASIEPNVLAKGRNPILQEHVPRLRQVIQVNKSNMVLDGLRKHDCSLNFLAIWADCRYVYDPWNLLEKS